MVTQTPCRVKGFSRTSTATLYAAGVCHTVTLCISRARESPYATRGNPHTHHTPHAPHTPPSLQRIPLPHKGNPLPPYTPPPRESPYAIRGFPSPRSTARLFFPQPAGARRKNSPRLSLRTNTAGLYEIPLILQGDSHSRWIANHLTLQGHSYTSRESLYGVRGFSAARLSTVDGGSVPRHRTIQPCCNQSGAQSSCRTDHRGLQLGCVSLGAAGCVPTASIPPQPLPHKGN